MQTARQTAKVLVISGFALAACATYVDEPKLGGPLPDDSGGESGTDTGGSSAAGSKTGGTNSGGVAGTASGGTAPDPSGGMAGEDTGGTDGTGGTGGTGGTNSTAAGTGGKGGSGGSATGGVSSGGSSGTGGGGGASGTGGKAGAGGTSGAGGVGGAAGTGGTGGAGGAAGSGGSGGGVVNLITNSGFETNSNGWSVFGGGATIASTSDQAHSGTKSLVITGRTQTYQGPQYSVMSAITPGTSYSLTVWGRLAASTPTGSLMATVRYTCSGGSSSGDNFAQWVPATAASSSSWTQLTGVRAFPTCAGGGTMTAAWLYIESPTASLSYYIDDVVLSTP